MIKYIINEKKDKEIVAELARIVFEYPDQVEIENWFNKYEIKNDQDKLSRLTQYIINYTYFFSYRSNSFKEEVLAYEKTSRELAIIKYFDLKDQLELLSQVNDNLNQEHFKVLKYSEQRDKKVILNSNVVIRKITELFNREKFEVIEQVEKILNISVLQMKSKCVPIHYKEKYSHGSYNLSIKEKLYKPYYDILFNFTETKRNYLISRKISLPSNKEVEALSNEINNFIEKSGYVISKKVMEDMIKRGLVNYNYAQLEHALNKTFIDKKRIKI